MSDILEYPKAIYSSDGKFATVGSKDAEDAQRDEWGEALLADTPNPLSLKMDQNPVADLTPSLPENVPETAEEPEAALPGSGDLPDGETHQDAPAVVDEPRETVEEPAAEPQA
jgi:hypothetical protein